MRACSLVPNQKARRCTSPIRYALIKGRYCHQELTAMQEKLSRYYTFPIGIWIQGELLWNDRVLSSYINYKLTSSDAILVPKPTVLKECAVVQSLPTRSWQQTERMPHCLHLDLETFSATLQLTWDFPHLYLCMTF
jgi:hypothetical protein